MTAELLLLWCIAGLAGVLSGRTERPIGVTALLAVALGPLAFLIGRDAEPKPIPVKVQARRSRSRV